MNVEELMNRSPKCVSPDTTVGDIAKLMVEHHISGIPVVDADEHMLGLVTDEDVVAKHARLHLPWYVGIVGTVLPLETHDTDDEIRHILAATAKDLMTARPATVTPSTTVDDAASIMVDRGAIVLPVVQSGRIVGLLSREDIIRLVLVEEDGDDSPDT